MSFVNSDLEEGEIRDDSPPSPNNIPVVRKKKSLPKRYIIRDKTNHKHKKDCKYAAHHHIQKPKLKKSPCKEKSPHKKTHKPFCSHQKANKSPKTIKSVDFSKHKLSKNDKSLPQLSLIAEMKSTFKDVVVTKLGSKINNKSESGKNQKETFSDKTPNKTCRKNELEHPKIQLDSLMSDTEDIFIVSDSRQDNSKSKSCDQPLVKDEKDQSSTPKIDPKNNLEHVNDLNSNSSLENKNEESEDEEELRRIALATFAKRKVQSSDSIPNASLPDSSGLNDDDDDIQIIHDTNNLEMDNYEIVDMEVDDDLQDSADIIQTAAENPSVESSENLFVIDTNPSVDLVGNKENAPSESRTASDIDDEFELDMLRAELINSMANKKYPPEESEVEVKKVDISRSQQSSPVFPKKNSYTNYRKTNTFYHRKPLQSVKRSLLRRNVIKSFKHPIKNQIPFRINKPVVPPPVEAKKQPERLVISLNAESSSDESDGSEDNDAVPENPVESIVALISDCRQKSSENSTVKAKEVVDGVSKAVVDSVSKAVVDSISTAVVDSVSKAVVTCVQKPVVDDVPKAVSCLSKAQQEEYNTLKKILAEKKKVSPAQESEAPKNGSVHSPLDDLKVLEKKLIELRNKLQSKKEYMTSLTKDEKSKKFQYMKAKLSAQHLREQFIAAEKIRKAKLLEWSEACNNLKVVKESVSTLENKIGQVRNLCTKIGSSINGKSYNLPLSPSTRQQSS